MRIAEYLGKDVSHLLGEAPFKNWPFEKSVEDDLEERLIHYEFKEHGFELRCDQNNKVSVIFFDSDHDGGLDETLLDISFSWNQRRVLEYYGNPSQSGGKTNDPILGKHGAWDRFDLQGYAIHIEYHIDSDKIKRITLMRSDVIPK